MLGIQTVFSNTVCIQNLMQHFFYLQITNQLHFRYYILFLIDSCIACVLVVQKYCVSCMELFGATLEYDGVRVA